MARSCIFAQTEVYEDENEYSVRQGDFIAVLEDQAREKVESVAIVCKGNIGPYYSSDFALYSSETPAQPAAKE